MSQFVKRVADTTNIVTLQYAVYIEGGSLRSNIGRIVPVWDVVVQYEPNCCQHFPCDGYLYLHLVLASDDSLVIAERVIEASSCLGCCPRAFDERFPQELVSVGDLPCPILQLLMLPI